MDGGSALSLVFMRINTPKSLIPPQTTDTSVGMLVFGNSCLTGKCAFATCRRP